MIENATSKTILAVAADCFSRYGYDATTTRQIAQESGVNMAMLQYYFGCKEKILETLLLSQSSLIREQLEPLAGMEGTAWQRLEKMQHIIVEYSWNNKKLYKIFMQELLLHQRQAILEIAHQSFTETFQVMKNVINAGILEKEFGEDVDAELVISMLKGTLFFMLNIQTSFCPQQQETEISKQRVNLFFSQVLKRYLRPS